MVRGARLAAGSNQWFCGLATGLLRNEPSVVGLLERNPFPDEPPRYIRAILYEYQFTTPAERRETGAWWKRGSCASILARRVSLTTDVAGR